MEKDWSLSCEGCGSKDVTLRTEAYGICNMCGSKVYLRATKPKINTSTSHTIANRVANLKDIRDEDDFHRDALLYLVNVDNVPEDIFRESNFDYIRTYRPQFLRIYTNFNISYSALAGENETEYVTRYRTVRDANGRSHRESYRESRTVTHWRRVSGVFDTSVPTITRIDKNLPFGLSEKMDYMGLLDKSEDDMIPYDKTTEVLPCTAEDLNKAVEIGKNRAREHCKASIVADQISDYKDSVNYNVTSKMHIIAKEYVLPMHYKGEEYYMTGYSSTKDNNASSTPTDHKRVNKLINTKALPLKMLALFMSILSIIMAFVIRRQDYIRLVPFIATNIITFVLYLKMYKAYKCTILIKNRDRKFLELNTLLSKLGLRTATIEELGECPICKLKRSNSDIPLIIIFIISILICAIRLFI